ncbi:MAG: type IX secretion system protein PorQ [Prevotellaceae bacterium]|jgi:hypothetical protein|nr:type IX secretion system protein PorQ [Prevotellaceae bacterium]
MKKILLVFTAVLFSLSAFSQAGKGVYQFLNLSMDARSVSLGGTNISLNDGDLNLAMNNPALLSLDVSNMLTFNYSIYLADIKYGSVGYAHYVGKSKKNIIGLGINYFDLGKEKGYTEEDVYTGTFTMKDIAVNLMYARILPKGFTVGATAKPVYSVYEIYTSAGMAFDIGAGYHNDSAMVDAGLVLKNVGWQFDGYRMNEDGSQHREPLPVNLLLGVSKRFKHAPIRISFTLHNLQTWNLGYERSAKIKEEYNKENDKVHWADMFFRHTIFAVEILPHKNFSLTASFNPRRRAEMNIADFKTIAGFAFGAELKVYKFRAGFALTQYQLGNMSYHFTLSTNFSEFGAK